MSVERIETQENILDKKLLNVGEIGGEKTPDLDAYRFNESDLKEIRNSKVFMSVLQQIIDESYNLDKSKLSEEEKEDLEQEKKEAEKQYIILSGLIKGILGQLKDFGEIKHKKEDGTYEKIEINNLLENKKFWYFVLKNLDYYLGGKVDIGDLNFYLEDENGNLEKIKGNIKLSPNDKNGNTFISKVKFKSNGKLKKMNYVYSDKTI